MGRRCRGQVRAATHQCSPPHLSHLPSAPSTRSSHLAPGQDEHSTRVPDWPVHPSRAGLLFDSAMRQIEMGATRVAPTGKMRHGPPQTARQTSTEQIDGSRRLTHHPNPVPPLGWFHDATTRANVRSARVSVCVAEMQQVFGEGREREQGGTESGRRAGSGPPHPTPAGGQPLAK